MDGQIRSSRDRRDDYLNVLIFQLVDENRDRIKAVVRGRVTRCHFAEYSGG